MAISEPETIPGTIVRVPFPYTNAETRQHRPALVVAQAGPAEEPFLLWVVMITSASHRGWPGDLELPTGPETGLPAPSIVRTAKIATIERPLAESRGQVSPELLARVRMHLVDRLGFGAGADPQPT